MRVLDDDTIDFSAKLERTARKKKEGSKDIPYFRVEIIFF